MPPAFNFPDGKRFAFTILDDTDVATLANVRPIYDLFHDLGMRTTKTVWPVGCPEGSPNFSASDTLDDESYRNFVVDLHARGFEITWHGPTMESSRRERVIHGLQRFREIFGFAPRIHVNHAHNRDNLYWGHERLDDPLLRFLMRRASGTSNGYFGGHRPDSEFWWGDLCQESFEYARNLTCNQINTASFNPSMPYRDPRRALVPWWFSASDAEGVDEFNELLSSRNQDRLEAEGGFCIVATHLGKGFVNEGRVNAVTRNRLQELTARNGWFPTVGELLDWLRSQRATDSLPPSEWRRMQWSWARDLARRKFDALRGRHPRTWQGI